jgi:hypothetical protein
VTFSAGVENFFFLPSSKTTIQHLPHPVPLLASKFFSKFFPAEMPPTKESYAFWRSSDGVAFKAAVKVLLEKCLTDDGEAREPTIMERRAMIETKTYKMLPPVLVDRKNRRYALQDVVQEFS